MTVRIISISIVLLLFSSLVYASKDRIIKVSGNGELVGLPEIYSPAKIDLNDKYIKIGRVKLNLPACIFKYFDVRGEFDLKVTTDWFNESSKPPTSISFRVSPKGKDFEYRLFFMIEALIPAGVQVITHESSSVTAFHELSLRKSCYKEIGQSYEVD